MKLLQFFKRDLVHEAHEWVDDGLIQTEQAEQILARYGTSLADKREHSTGYWVLSSIAALFIGLAVILVVSRNWDEIPRWLRMSTLIGLTGITQAIGVWRYHRGHCASARILLFLGSLFFGASIFLIAQIYHLGEHFPDGIFYWALGVVPLALITESVLLMILGSSLVLLWQCSEMLLGFFPWFAILFIAVKFWFAFRMRYSLLTFIAALGSATLLLEDALRHLMSPGLRVGIEHFYFSLGMLFLIFVTSRLVSLRTKRSPYVEYALASELGAMRLGILSLLIFSSQSRWSDILRHSYPPLPLLLLCSVVGMTSAALWLFPHYLADSLPTRRWWLESASTIGFATYLAVMCLIIMIDFASATMVLSIMSTFSLFTLGTWLIVRAFDKGSSAYFYTGIGVLLITALIRYVDLIGGYVGSALILLISALALLVAAKVWHRWTPSIWERSQ